MKKYNCVIFDLDGTLADTYQGIQHSYEFAAKKMNLTAPTEKLVNEAIGAPLTEVFKEKFGLDEDNAMEAVKYYRKWYEDRGIYEVKLYPQMKEVCKELKENNIKIGVATLKKQDFAERILKNLGLIQYIDMVVGMDEKDVLKKSDMIKKTLDLLRQNPETTVLVGDSIYDAVGALEAEVDFIAVIYGFGFHKLEEVQVYKHVVAIRHPMELVNLLRK